ncbi:acyl-CoA dehydrogenase family protein [Sphingomonas sp. MG17]|uniref:Acyl-CoA dehydrogenase family protein n=1 Tax=Sphingomonas tagetis TaxID=2949092 RepID=A0A9X2HIF2_9SPHN|nr:acyl-CoA dehydrogenase family protein [Sphingomonas tagetis]MCP3731423.1 acyl-CoA dehydrogenase family protein [Sphingomonas tagetis]
MSQFIFPIAPETQEERSLRSRVRLFLETERAAGGFEPAADCWVSGVAPAFSRKLGQMGWIGMTWPKAYGGHALPTLHRLVVTEELLVAGAPVAAHWIADRQSGAQILKFGTEQQKQSILPRIAAGECYTCVGMSEPQAGSDLAAVTTKATKTPTGWTLSGRKIWSTVAHISSYMLVLARTSPADGKNRHVGLSQFLVDLTLPGIEISGIRDIAGHTHFNEVVFDDVQLTDDALLGTEGNGWAQCMGELAMERSGPERFLTTFLLLEHALATMPEAIPPVIVGDLIARLSTLRIMSRGIAYRLQAGEHPDTEAALVKQLGNAFEKHLFATIRGIIAARPEAEVPVALLRLRDEVQLRLPANTLRGGTTEILRGVIARQLGVR